MATEEVNDATQLLKNAVDVKSEFVYVKLLIEVTPTK